MSGTEMVDMTTTTIHALQMAQAATNSYGIATFIFKLKCLQMNVQLLFTIQCEIREHISHCEVEEEICI